METTGDEEPNLARIKVWHSEARRRSNSARAFKERCAFSRSTFGRNVHFEIIIEQAAHIKSEHFFCVIPCVGRSHFGGVSQECVVANVLWMSLVSENLSS